MNTEGSEHQNSKETSPVTLSFWARLVRGPIASSFLLSAFTLVGTILLYRHLPEADAGLLTLVLAITQLVLMLSSLGQPTLIQRLYSYTEGQGYDWLRDLCNNLLFSLPFIILLAFLAHTVYNLALKHALLIGFLTLTQLAILTESRILNASRRYVLSSVLIRLPNSLLFLPAIALMLINLRNELDFTLTIYAAVSFLGSIVGFTLLTQSRPRGSRAISWHERRSGFVFLFTQTSYTLPEQGVVALGGGLLPVSQLAEYGAVSPLLKPFDLIADVLRNILTTELIKLHPMQKRRGLTGLWVIGILSGVLAAATGPYVFDWIYSGKYAESTALIPWLALAGVFRLLEVYPRSHVIGQANQAILRSFVFWQIGSAAFLLAGGLFLITQSGVIAIGATMAAIQITRYGISEVLSRSMGPN